MYTIGRLGRKTRVKVDSIRFYERQGLLLAESKTPSGYRLYGEAAVRRLLVIKHAQRCGFTLAEIGRLLNPRVETAALRAATHRMLSDKKVEMDKTVGALQAMSEALGSLLVAMDRSGDNDADDVVSPEAVVMETLQTQRTPPSRRAAPPIGDAGVAASFRRALR